MAVNRESLIMELYKDTFGKNFNKYDISVRLDHKDGSLHMNEHREGEAHFTKAQIESARKFFDDSVKRMDSSGVDATKKKVFEISRAAIDLVMRSESTGEG